MSGLQTKVLIPAAVAAVTLLVLVLLLVSGTPSPGPTTAEEWVREANLLLDRNVVFGHGSFESLAAAMDAFRIRGAWERCKSDENRYILLYDVGDLHAFLTCKYVKGKYVCVAMGAEGRYPPDYNAWVERCLK